MNKFKKYLSEHPDAAEQFEKTGSIGQKPAEKMEDSNKKVSPKSGVKNLSR